MSAALPLKAIRYIRPMGRGSRSHLIHCENGELCVVPLPGTVPHREQLSAFVASRIARTLGLPAPESVVVEIGDSLVTETPELTRAREFRPEAWTGLQPGTCYAGSQNGALFDLLPDSYLASLSNPESFLHFLALHQWCSHLGPPQAVFCRSVASPQYSAEFVGLGRFFCGARLGFSDDPRNGVYYQKAVYSRVTGWDSFDPVLSNLILTSPDDLYNATQELPLGWSHEYRNELDRLVESLLLRRSRIRQLITQTRDQIPGLFPNWIRRAFVSTQHRFQGSPLLRLI